MIQLPLNANKPIYLIGAGGHCRVLVDSLKLNGCLISGYSAPESATWLENIGVKKIDNEELKELAAQGAQMVMAFVGANSNSLSRRYKEMHSLQKLGAKFPSIIHPSAIVSETATIDQGVQVLAGAIVNANAIINAAGIINTRSIVEHDGYIDVGVHIAPGSIILGGASIRKHSYVGTSSVIIQNQTVPENSFIKALSVYY